MKIKYIGTAACDYSPLLNTKFKDCLDKDARRSSCALIDGHILIDCGDHTIESLRIQNIPLNSIDTLLLTHLHHDHYQPENIRCLAAACESTLKIYTHNDAKIKLDCDLDGANVEKVPLKCGEEINISEDTSITAFPANHTEFPVHYLIESLDKKIYYALDGAWITYDAFHGLKNKAVDLLVLDGTVGDYEGDLRVSEHNSIPMIRLMLKSFPKFNICAEHAEIYISHIAPSLHKSHDETVELLKKDNIKVAFDGLEVTLPDR